MADAMTLLRNYPGVMLGGTPLPDSTLEFFLDVAASTIVAQRYPYEEDKTNHDMPPKYQWLQIQMAVEMIMKLGAEGEVRHAENTITREYAASYISPELLKFIVPKAGFPT